MESTAAVASSPPPPSKPPDPCCVSPLPPNPPVPPVPPDPPPESLLCSPSSDASPHLAAPHRCSLIFVGLSVSHTLRRSSPSLPGKSSRASPPPPLPFIQPSPAPTTIFSSAQNPSLGHASPPPLLFLSDLPLSTAPPTLWIDSPSLVGTIVEFGVLYGSENLVEFIKIGVVLFLPSGVTKHPTLVCCQYSPALARPWSRLLWLSSSSSASISDPFLQVLRSYLLSCFLDMELSRLFGNELVVIMSYLSSCAPRCSIFAPVDSPYVYHCGIYIALLRSFTAVCGTLTAVCGSLTAVCGSLTMFSPLFGDMVVVSLIWWQLKEIIIFMFPSVIVVLSGIQYPLISLVERFIIPSFPLSWSGVDAQVLSVLQGFSSRLVIYSAFEAEPVINWIALDMLYQEVYGIVSLDRSLMSFFDELSVIYLLTMYWFALVHLLFRFVAFPLHLDVLSPPLMEFEV